MRFRGIEKCDIEKEDLGWEEGEDSVEYCTHGWFRVAEF